MPETMPENRYVIADREFYQESLVLRQIQWVKRQLKGYTLTSLSQEQIIDLIIEEGPGLLAIVLIPLTETRAQKLAQGHAGVKELTAWIEEHATAKEVMVIAGDFFRLNHETIMAGVGQISLLTQTPGAGSTVS